MSATSQDDKKVYNTFLEDEQKAEIHQPKDKTVKDLEQIKAENTSEPDQISCYLVDMRLGTVSPSFDLKSLEELGQRPQTPNETWRWKMSHFLVPTNEPNEGNFQRNSSAKGDQ